MHIDIQHEHLPVNHWQLPLHIFSRETDRHSLGCEFHWHELLELYYVKEGALTLLINGETYCLFAGDIAIVNSCHPHKSIHFSDHTVHYCLQIDLSALIQQEESSCNPYILNLLEHRVLLTTFIQNDSTLVQLITSMIHEYTTRTEGYELALKGHLYYLFSLLYRKHAIANTPGLNLYSEGKDVHHVGHVLTYIATHYDTKLTLRDLATANDISVSHLCRIFKKRTGITIINYINQLRCDRARHLLSSGYSVTEAAMAVGFSDSNYFSRVFKKTFGISPSSG